MKILDYFFKLLYPPRCVLCGEILGINQREYFCKECAKSLSFTSGASCRICGRPIDEGFKLCSFCAGASFSFEKNYASFTYDEIISSLIKKFKYGKHPYIGKGLGNLMGEYYKNNISEKVDFLVPVPIHKTKRRKRGFNQAQILASIVSNYTNVPVLNDLLIRKRATLPQSRLTKEARAKNVENAFVLNKKYFIGSKIIMLIDDIYTTGSTLDSCGKVLMTCGASKVYGFCLSIAVKNTDDFEEDFLFRI